MTLSKHLILSALSILLLSCGGEKNLDQNYSLNTTAIKKTLVNGGAIVFSLKAKQNYAIDSIVYHIDNQRIGSTKNGSEYKTNLQSKTLGHKTVLAKIYTEAGATSASQKITLLNNKPPKVYVANVINKFPHQTYAYTQGLEFVGDTLYESNGEKGKSTLRKLDYKTGIVLQEHKIANQYFAEGLTIMDDKIYQLTWQENTGFIYDLKTFEKTGTFAYGKSREGWGLTNDGKVMYKSDGTSKIWRLNPETLEELSYIEPTDHKKVTIKLNELEFFNGKIYANNYGTAVVSIINPETGAIEGVIDLRPLTKMVQGGLNAQNEVLNGIAYKHNENRLFVTGKHWNTLFEIEIVEK